MSANAANTAQKASIDEQVLRRIKNIAVRIALRYHSAGKFAAHPDFADEHDRIGPTTTFADTCRRVLAWRIEEVAAMKPEQCERYLRDMERAHSTSPLHRALADFREIYAAIQRDVAEIAANEGHLAAELAGQ